MPAPMACAQRPRGDRDPRRPGLGQPARIAGRMSRATGGAESNYLRSHPCRQCDGLLSSLPQRIRFAMFSCSLESFTTPRPLRRRNRPRLLTRHRVREQLHVRQVRRSGDAVPAAWREHRQADFVHSRRSGFITSVSTMTLAGSSPYQRMPVKAISTVRNSPCVVISRSPTMSRPSASFTTGCSE